jgi:uncharacterized membrane protein
MAIMAERPKINVSLSTADRVEEAVCIVLLVSLWIGVVVVFPDLPKRIPRHFNAAGTADGFGDKSNIFVLPLVATFEYFLLTILQKYPHIYNYLNEVTLENAEKMYTSATKLMRHIKLVVLIILSAVVVLIYRSVITNSFGIGTWFLPASIGLLLIPLVIYLTGKGRSGKANV